MSLHQPRYEQQDAEVRYRGECQALFREVLAARASAEAAEISASARLQGELACAAQLADARSELAAYQGVLRTECNSLYEYAHEEVRRERDHLKEQLAGAFTALDTQSKMLNDSQATRDAWRKLLTCTKGTEEAAEAEVAELRGECAMLRSELFSAQASAHEAASEITDEADVSKFAGALHMLQLHKFSVGSGGMTLPLQGEVLRTAQGLQQQCEEAFCERDHLHEELAAALTAMGSQDRMLESLQAAREELYRLVGSHQGAEAAPAGEECAMLRSELVSALACAKELVVSGKPEVVGTDAFTEALQDLQQQRQQLKEELVAERLAKDAVCQEAEELHQEAERQSKDIVGKRLDTRRLKQARILSVTFFLVLPAYCACRRWAPQPRRQQLLHSAVFSKCPF